MPREKKRTCDDNTKNALANKRTDSNSEKKLARMRSTKKKMLRVVLMSSPWRAISLNVFSVECIWIENRRQRNPCHSKGIDQQIDHTQKKKHRSQCQIDRSRRNGPCNVTGTGKSTSLKKIIHDSKAKSSLCKTRFQTCSTLDTAMRSLQATIQ